MRSSSDRKTIEGALPAMSTIRSRPRNIVVILADDLGFSDLGCYGGEIRTPNLDRLARTGVRMSNFYTTPRCSPSRAALLTGRHPHEVGIGVLTSNDLPDGYPGSLDPKIPTMAQCLQEAGYATYLSGKWHLSSDDREPDVTWPTRRGFDDCYGLMIGAASYFQPTTLHRGETPIDEETADPDYYLTDAITDNAIDFLTSRADTSCFLYLSYTAPHRARSRGRHRHRRAGSRSSRQLARRYGRPHGRPAPVRSTVGGRTQPTRSSGSCARRHSGTVRPLPRRRVHDVRRTVVTVGEPGERKSLVAAGEQRRRLRLSSTDSTVVPPGQQGGRPIPSFVAVLLSSSLRPRGQANGFGVSNVFHHAAPPGGSHMGTGHSSHEPWCDRRPMDCD